MNEEALAEHYLRVADAAHIPILVYSVPIFTHVKVEAPLIARVAGHQNILGMKDSSGDVEGVRKIIAAAPKTFQTLVGSASTLYESLELGAVGAILALACAFPDLCAEIYETSRKGEAARSHALSQKLITPAKLLGPQYGIAGLKYVLDRLGYFGGAARLPLLPLTEVAKREIDAMLTDVAEWNADGANRTARFVKKDHAQFNGSGTQTNPTFGQYTADASPRRMVLAAKFRF